VVHLPRCGVTSVEWGQSGVRRIVRAAGDAKDHERVVFTFESIHNLTPADVYCGRGQIILLQREKIKRQTIALRRLQHQRRAA
jgi:hypothetical protein